ncbi:MAG: threonine synthase [Deltaproteobacteria bacterium RIFOXYD12_FULL_57_12]|nr:MAG: threonine synthase [Deltaproteobacteria bacterium RIFOXYD12_FULL_57_12]
MRFISTRGGIAPIQFKEAVLMGLATDGGLLLPESLPVLPETTLAGWLAMAKAKQLSYQQLAFEIMRLFITDIPADELRRLVDRSYATFAHPAITPLVAVADLHILELFHGPTLAFKDVALQFLGNVFEYILKESGGRMNILGATSGDTGSAAIYGVRGKEGISIFILHPHKRVSPIQELQMTTVLDDNVFNLAIRGTFDDGQTIVKQIFNDIAFKDAYQLGAINSINWARILAQVVYYVYAWLQVAATTGATEVDFAVPTGNFGDIFAGFVAKRLLAGNRLRTLILATNENDLLTRFVNQGDYSLGTVVPTTSPSMDIQVASNFERFLYYLYNEDPQRVSQAMADFAKSGRLTFDAAEQEKIRAVFVAKRVSQLETEETIRAVDASCRYVLDPHTAVGVNAAQALRTPGVPVVCLATAHPAKFGSAVEAAIGRSLALPAALADLAGRPSRCEIVAADTAIVKNFVVGHAR